MGVRQRGDASSHGLRSPCYEGLALGALNAWTHRLLVLLSQRVDEYLFVILIIPLPATIQYRSYASCHVLSQVALFRLPVLVLCFILICCLKIAHITAKLFGLQTNPARA